MIPRDWRTWQHFSDPSQCVPSGERDTNQYRLNAGCACNRFENFLVGVDARATELENKWAGLRLLQQLRDRVPYIFDIDWLQSHLAVAEHWIDWEPLQELEDGGEKRIIRPKHNRWADQNRISKGLPNRQFAFAALSDIERCRVGIGTNPRNMNEQFDAGALRLSRDPLGGLDVDGVERLPFLLGVKADCIHDTVSISKRIGN